MDAGAEWLAAMTTGTNITATYNNSTQVLTLSGTDTAADYQQVLRTVTYVDMLGAAASTGGRSLTFTVTDANGAIAADTATLAGVAALPGDANLDGNVDIQDLAIFLANFGRSGATWSQANFAGDATVDIDDLTILLTNFGLSIGPPAITVGNSGAVTVTAGAAPVAVCSI